MWKSTDAVTAKSRRWRELHSRRNHTGTTYGEPPRHRADAVTATIARRPKFDFHTGAYPRFDGLPLNLYDPFNLFAKASEEKKARGRNAEVNNGRLAMIGLFSLLAESKVPGSVPFLDQFDFPAYAGNVMVPFEGQFSLLG